MRKKYLIGLAITLTVVCIILMFLNNPRIVIYMNWKIYLPKPQERNVIYRFQYREGEDLEIWQYAEKDTFGDTFQKQVDLFEKRSIIKKSSWEDQYKFKLSILIYGQMYKREEKSLGDLFRNREELVYDKKYFI